MVQVFNERDIYFCLKFDIVKLFETLHPAVDIKMQVLQIKLFEEINILPILSSSKFKFPSTENSGFFRDTTPITITMTGTEAEGVYIHLPETVHFKSKPDELFWLLRNDQVRKYIGGSRFSWHYLWIKLLDYIQFQH